VAVSPTYAREILTPAFGCGLETYLTGRGEAVTGILNGLDLDSFDPSCDPALAARFSSADLSGRRAAKAGLQQELGLPVEPGLPLLAMVGRIDRQKGVDIALQVLRGLAEQAWQFVLLGSGDPALEQDLRALQAELPGRVRAVLRYDAAFSRRLYAGADLFLMPSRYEPCGLAQMIAMRYGCVPVVSATGGLRDTVEAGKTGFLFEASDLLAMQSGLLAALAAYSDPDGWLRLQRNGMRKDFSWRSSARQYARLYLDLAEGSGQAGQVHPERVRRSP
jgi:starch synthase